MELKNIIIEKFKKIDKIEFELSHLNIFVGSNGSGKSSILQSIHLASCAMRQAKELRPGKTSAISIHELDYLPSENYAELGHNALWGNSKTTPSSKIKFTFTDSNDAEVISWCEIRSARNAGISIQGSAPGETLRLFRPIHSDSNFSYFSSYIPGISGITNQEQKQSKRVVLKACSYGDANVYLRNALLLLKDTEISQIENWLARIIGDIELKISHNNERDLTINASATLNGKSSPLELLGTGYLQLIQIFCYVLLFKPKILLIDEPDIHLHPNVQEKLPKILHDIAQEKAIKIVISTHSPFIIRGAPVTSKIYWMENGNIQDSNHTEIELAMGWGAFGKKIILFSEDAKNDLLKKIINQWPDISSKVAFHPGNGYKSLLKKDEAKELYNTLGQKYHILVHRDRDSLTDDEVDQLINNFNDEGISLWITDHSDIEAYFCNPELICSNIPELSQQQIMQYIDNIITTKTSDIKQTFDKHREAHNHELYKHGGSPPNDVVIQELQQRFLNGAKGKFVFNQLKSKIKNNFSEEIAMQFDLSGTIADSLKQKINTILNG